MFSTHPKVSVKLYVSQQICHRKQYQITSRHDENQPGKNSPDSGSNSASSGKTKFF